MVKKNIPEGYMEDAQGRLVPEESIKEIDRLRNDVVMEMMVEALRMSEELSAFKVEVMDSINAFIELSAEKYGVKMRGEGSNVSLLSFDGKYKIVRACDDFIRFDERLQIAKQLVDECLKRWCDGGKAELRAVVNDAFQVDRAGRINTRRILALRRIKIDDETWKKAMLAISESVQVIDSKSYVRFYERQTDGGYKQLNLSIAA